MYLSFAAMVEQEFKGIHTVKEYANRLGVSQRVLSLCTHDNVKKTPLTIINERLLLEAKRKLRFTSLRVSEIAYYLGFVDASHFVAFFKKHSFPTRRSSDLYTELPANRMPIFPDSITFLLR